MASETRSPYRITCPFTCRAARPATCMSELRDRKNPCLSASITATNDTSGKSSPSLNKLIPTRTSNSPRRRSRRICTRLNVSISLCKYRTRRFTPRRNSLKSSAIRFVRVVTRIRSFRSVRSRISPIKLSICPSLFLTSTTGSNSPVGRITCSTTTPFAISNSR